MKTENTLYEANETLRIAGMYSFLFYLAACAVAVYVISRDKIPDWFAIILCVIGFVFTVVFLLAAIILFKSKKNKVVMEQNRRKPLALPVQGNKVISSNCSDRAQDACLAEINVLINHHP
jgi:glucan phosphoethanolaminetransferase (alkaline phosphatase superfamily)